VSVKIDPGTSCLAADRSAYRAVDDDASNCGYEGYGFEPWPPHFSHEQNDCSRDPIRPAVDRLVTLIPAQGAATRWSTDLISRSLEVLGEATERRCSSALGPVVVARLAGRQRGRGLEAGSHRRSVASEDLVVFDASARRFERLTGFPREITVVG